MTWKLVNLTAHSLRIHGNDGFVMNLAAPDDNTEAWCYFGRDPAGVVEIESRDRLLGSIYVSQPNDQVRRLPPPQDGAIYIVSHPVARSAKRPDVLSPGEMVYNRHGEPVGCMGLTSHSDDIMYPLPDGGDKYKRTVRPAVREEEPETEEKGVALTPEEEDMKIIYRDEMKHQGGNITRAAESMGIHRSTFRRRLVKFGLLDK